MRLPLIVTAIPFEYSNLSERPTGRLMAVASRLSAGVRQVQAQIAPFAADWQAANQVALRTTGPLWVVLGDSMSQGIGAPAFDQGWVGQLAERLEREGHRHRVLNLSVSGARLRDVLDRQLPALRSLAIDADLLTVMIGSNDMVSPAHRRQLVAGFAELLGQVPTGTIIAGLPNPHAVSRQVNALLAAAATAGRIGVAELGQVTPRSWRGKLAADHFHPNELGYAELAEAFARAVNLGHTPPKPT